MKFLKYTFFGLVFLCVLVGASSIKHIISSKRYIEKDYPEGKISAVEPDCIRIHSLALGDSEKDAIINDEQLVDSQISSYTLVKFKTFSFESDGHKIWVCDATIDVKKSIAQPNAPKLSEKNL